MPIDDALEEMAREDEFNNLKKKVGKLEKQLKKEKTGREKTEKECKELKIELDKTKKKYNKLDGQFSAYKAMQSQQIPALKENQDVFVYCQTVIADILKHKPVDDEDNAVHKFILLPNFFDIYVNARILQNIGQRREYFMMEGFKHEFYNYLLNSNSFFIKLAPFGLNLICPYFEPVENSGFDKCYLKKDGIMASCCAMHYQCEAFKAETGKFAIGETEYVPPLRKYDVPDLSMDPWKKEEKERALYHEIEAYWRDD